MYWQPTVNLNVRTHWAPEVWHMAPARWERRDCVPSILICGTSWPMFKLRYGRKIYNFDDFSLVTRFITELHPYVKC